MISIYKWPLLGIFVIFYKSPYFFGEVKVGILVASLKNKFYNHFQNKFYNQFENKFYNQFENKFYNQFEK